MKRYVKVPRPLWADIILIVFIVVGACVFSVCFLCLAP